MPGSVLLRHVAVVAGVALDRARRAGVAGDCGAVLGLVDLEPDVGDDAAACFSSEMSMMRAAPTRGPFPPELPLLVGGELVDLDEVGLAADRHRDRVLRDRIGQSSRLISRTCGFGLRAWISLRSTIDQARRAGHVGAVAVARDRHAVRAVVADPERHAAPAGSVTSTAVTVPLNSDVA